MRNAFLFLGLAGLFLGWNLPNHYPLWTTFHSEWIAAFGIGLLFIGVLWPRSVVKSQRIAAAAARAAGLLEPMTHPAGLRVEMPLAARTWLLVALLAPLQYAAGKLDFYGDALLGFLYPLGVALAIYIGLLWAAQDGRAAVLRALFLTMLWAGLAAGGIALWQWVRLPTAGWWAMELIGERPYGNFAQPNLYGLAMVLAIVSATALFEMRVLAHRASYYLLLLFFGFAMLVSESRASLVAVLAVSGFWLLTQSRVAARLRWYEVVLAVALGSALHAGLAGIEQVLHLKAAVAREVLDVGPREAIWAQFRAAIQAHPWVGYGFGQGVLALREVSAGMAPGRNTIYAHNVALDLMTWIGVPLGLGLLTALGGWMLSWLRSSTSPELQAQRRFVFAAWLALAVQSLLEFPFAHLFFLLPAAVLAGAISGPGPVALTAAAPAHLGRGPGASHWAVALGALGAVLLALTTWDYLQFEGEFRAIRFDKGRFGDLILREPHQGPVMLDQLAALNASAHYRITPGMAPVEIDQLARLARRFHLLPTRVEYAKALALNGRRAEADAELQILRGIYHPSLWLQIERDWVEWLAAQPERVAAAP